ncbi:hypothetical protein RQP46_008293 [Phenoliferia psychrophenolica]
MHQLDLDEALDVAAHNLDRYCFSSIEGSRAPLPWWDLPHLATKSTRPGALCDLGRGPWGEVMQHADEVTRIALRDTCKIYERFQHARLNLARVVLDGRDPKRIYTLDYRAVLRIPVDLNHPAPTSPRSRKKKPYAKRLSIANRYMTAYPVLKELPKRAAARKVVSAGSVFFELYAFETYDKPPYIDFLRFQGFDDASARHTGIVTPFKQTLVETKEVHDHLFCGHNGLECSKGSVHLERWASSRTLLDPAFQELSALKAEDSNLHRSKMNLHKAVHAAWKLDYENWLDEQESRPKPAEPDEMTCNTKDVEAWEQAVLDAEGMNDTFTLEAAAAIVTGRFRPSSSADGKRHWAHSFAKVSTFWRKKESEPLLIMLSPTSQGWLPMDATFPLIDEVMNMQQPSDPPCVVEEEAKTLARAKRENAMLVKVAKEMKMPLAVSLNGSNTLHLKVLENGSIVYAAKDDPGLVELLSSLSFEEGEESESRINEIE